MLLPLAKPTCWLCILLIVILHPPRLVDAARCEGTASITDSHACAVFHNETFCNKNGLTVVSCHWAMDSNGGGGGACVVDMPLTCSELENSQDCHRIRGCYWAEVPVWMWLAINIPVWLVASAISLICYRKLVRAIDREYEEDNITIRSQSITLDDDSITINSQAKEEQEQNQDIFGNPLSFVVDSKAIRESEASSSCSSEASDLEIEDGGRIVSEVEAK